jgi:TRAP-type C4-dicarboxylate transport system permease small subunit
LRRSFLKTFEFIELIMTLIAGIALLLMMLVVVYDITGRSLGLWNVLSTVEQTTLYMMLLGFFGLVLCFRDQGNIVVDIATQSLPERRVRRIDAFWAVVAAAILLPLGYVSFADGLVLHGYGQRSEVLGISPLVHYSIAGFGLIATALVSFVTGLRLLLSPSSGASTGGRNPEFTE